MGMPSKNNHWLFMIIHVFTKRTIKKYLETLTPLEGMKKHWVNKSKVTYCWDTTIVLICDKINSVHCDSRTNDKQKKDLLDQRNWSRMDIHCKGTSISLGMQVLYHQKWNFNFELRIFLSADNLVWQKGRMFRSSILAFICM